jgi:hypothetical protein
MLHHCKSCCTCCARAVDDTARPTYVGHNMLMPSCIKDHTACLLCYILAAGAESLRSQRGLT